MEILLLRSRLLVKTLVQVLLSMFLILEMERSGFQISAYVMRKSRLM